LNLSLYSSISAFLYIFLALTLLRAYATEASPEIFLASATALASAIAYPSFLMLALSAAYSSRVFFTVSWTISSWIFYLSSSPKACCSNLAYYALASASFDFVWISRESLNDLERLSSVSLSTGLYPLELISVI